ncbi:hypothetical protein BDR06DRAFT_963096, partial [Suillus hirtellus]
MPNEPLVNFAEHGRHFLVTNPDDVNEVRFVAREQLKAFILYSHALRNKAPSNRPDPPLGYEYFVRAYNHEGLASTATFIDDQGVVKCEGSSYPPHAWTRWIAWSGIPQWRLRASAR